MKTEKMINPHYYHDEKKIIEKDFINTKLGDLASYGKADVTWKPKDYAEATKTFDKAWRATGFRQ